MKYAVGFVVGVAVSGIVCMFYVTNFSSNVMNSNQNQVMQEDSETNALSTSRSIIEAILEDLSATYKQVGGGGISAITQKATGVYEVSISQEGRIDLITYEVVVEQDGQVSIKNRSESSRSY